MRLVLAVMMAESHCDSTAHGDGGKSHGSMCVMQGVIDDVNRWTGLNLTVEDAHNDEIAVMCFELYMAHYATRKRIGRRVTDQDRYRIWNGGPDGWRQPGTVKNWKKVERYLE